MEALRTREEKFVLLFEAAKRSLLAADLYYESLANVLRSLEPLIVPGVELDTQVVPALLSSVAFIDFAHRFGQLVDQLPLLNSRELELRKLRAALAEVERARNHLQHLRGDLSANEQIDYPLLGSISWSSGQSCFLACLSQASPTSTPTMAYDIVNRRWVRAIEYRLGRFSTDLEGVLAQMHATYGWVVRHTGLSSQNLAKLVWDKTISFRAEMRIADDSNASKETLIEISRPSPATQAR